MGTAVIDRSRRIRYPSLAHRAVAEQLNQDTLEEELRLLYVATTRAKEKMILIGSPKDMERRCGNWSQSTRTPGWELPAGDVLGASSWMDWIGRTVARHRDGSVLRSVGAGDLGSDFYEPADEDVWKAPVRFNVKIWSTGDVEALLPERAVVETLDLPIAAIGRKQRVANEIDPTLREEVNLRYTWEYPYAGVHLPAKMSVTEYARLRAATEDDDGRGTDEFAFGELSAQGGFRSPSLVPGEKEKVTPAERGVAVHRLLALGEFADAADEEHIQQEVVRLVDAELLTPQQAESIDPHTIARFFSSSLGKQVQQALAGRNSTRIWREKSFTMLVEAGRLGDLGDMVDNLFVPDDADGEKVMVQGTIDVLMGDGGRYTVIDYKTDRVRPGDEERLAKAYEYQVKLYAEFVCRAAPGAKIEAYLVFLATGRIVSVPV